MIGGSLVLMSISSIDIARMGMIGRLASSLRKLISPDESDRAAHASMPATPPSYDNARARYFDELMAIYAAKYHGEMNTSWPTSRRRRAAGDSWNAIVDIRRFHADSLTLAMNNVSPPPLRCKDLLLHD